MAVSTVSVSEPTIKNYNGTKDTIKKTNIDISGTYLKQETIDTLKEYDEKSQITPLTTRIASNALQQQDVAAITTLISQFKTSYADIASETSFLKRKTSTAGSGSVSASIEDGVAEQNIRMSVQQLAKNDSYQTKGFSSKSDAVFSGVNINGSTSGASMQNGVTFGIKVGDKSYDINVNNTTTLEQLAQKITDATSGAVTAKILNTGGKDPYKLVFQTKNTGADNAIQLTKKEADGDFTPLLSALGFKVDNQGSATNGVRTFTITGDEAKGGKKLSQAQDAQFTYNGVNMTRSSNTVDDIIIGATFTLNNVDEQLSTGEYKDTTINVTKDTESMVKTMQNMVQAYNTLKSNLDTATSYDSESKAAGSLNGISEITSIKRQINDLITTTNKDGKSLMDFGFEFTDKGVLSLNTDKLKSAINDDYDGFKKFFSDNTTYDSATFYSAGSVTSNAQPWKGKITINDKEFNLEEIGKNLSSNRPLQIAQLIKEINESNLGVKASLNDDGRLTLKGSTDSTVKIQTDSDSSAALGLSSGSKTGSKTISEGFFSKMNKLVDGMINSKNGSLTNFASELKSQNKLLTEQKKRTQESIDKKYEQMSNLFISYATTIAKMTNAFSSLQSTINAQNKSD